MLAASATILVALGAWWGVQAWQVRESVEEHAGYWSRPRGEPGGLVYVALGDSTAQGIGATAPDRGYVGVLAERVRASTGRPVLVVNLSETGATVRDVVDEQLPRLAVWDADVVTVGVGANDIPGDDPAQFERDTTALVDDLPPGTVVADVAYFMHGRAQENASEAADTIRILAERRELRVAPLQDTMRADDWVGMFTNYAADWFHPNDRGYRVWAEAFWTVLGSRVR